MFPYQSAGFGQNPGAGLVDVAAEGERARELYRHDSRTTHNQGQSQGREERRAHKAKKKQKEAAEQESSKAAERKQRRPPMYEDALTSGLGGGGATQAMGTMGYGGLAPGWYSSGHAGQGFGETGEEYQFNRDDFGDSESEAERYADNGYPHRQRRHRRRRC